MSATAENAAENAAVQLTDVSVRTPAGDLLLDGIDWTVRAGEHWALLGPNGAGKSTLLAIVGAQRHPSRGSVRVLGEPFGRTDLRELRARIGVVDDRARIPSAMTPTQVVLTGATGSVQLVPGRYRDADRERAERLLDELGCAHLHDRPAPTWSAGERARVRLARALMPDPALLLLDEPATGLDLPGREDLLAALAGLAASRPAMATVLVTHHLEEVPASTTHALLLAGGRITALGPADSVLTSAAVSAAFGRPFTVDHRDGRWAARAG